MVNVNCSIGVLVSIAVLASWGVSGAKAACSDELRCIAEFASFTSVVWKEDGFWAAGVRSDGDHSVGLLNITSEGTTPAVIPVKTPSLPKNADSIEMGDVRKLIPMTDSSIVMLADVRITQASTTRQAGWAVRIDSEGNSVWEALLDDPSANIIFHSGLYEVATGSLVIVGRKTSGSDNGRCEFWSQSLVASINAEDGKLGPISYFGDATKALSNRQAFLDLAPGQAKNSYIATGFVTAAHAAGGKRCQDNVIVATLSRSGDRWVMAETGRIGSNDADEDAFTIKPIGSGRYLVAGFGKDPVSGALAAQVSRIRVSPYSVEMSVSRPYPPDGSDRIGQDSYRTLLPISSSRMLLGGSISTGRESTKKPIWQVISSDLLNVGQLTAFSEQNAELLDAAISPDGTILAVGRAFGDGSRIGWLAFVGANLAPIARRPPDKRLPSLSSIPVSSGVYRLPPNALSPEVGYLGGDLSAGSEITFSLSLPTTTTVRISAHAGSGDLDLTLKDNVGRLISFSNYKGLATELILATLSRGDYKLSLVAQTQIRAFEIKFSSSSKIDVPLISEVLKLSDAERRQLGALLAASGYLPFTSPEIAVGSESIRALLAAQEGAASAVGPGAIGRVLTQALRN